MIPCYLLHTLPQQLAALSIIHTLEYWCWCELWLPTACTLHSLGAYFLWTYALARRSATGVLVASQVLGYLYAWCSLHEHTYLGGGTFAAVYVSRCLKAVGFLIRALQAFASGHWRCCLCCSYASASSSRRAHRDDQAVLVVKLVVFDYVLPRH